MKELAGSWTLTDNGNTVTNGKTVLAIGDYVDYTYDTASAYSLTTDLSGYTDPQTISQTTGLKWRVLGIDANGRLTLISDSLTYQNIYFQGAKGYNNGVYLLNDICAKQYSNQALGITARSLTIEDMEAGYSSAGYTTRNNYSSVVRYGKTKSYGSGKNQYPVIYAEEKGSGINGGEVRIDGIGESVPFYTTEDVLKTKPARQGEETTGKESATASTDLTCTLTYYTLQKYKENFESEEFMNLIFPTNGSVWFASRTVSLESGEAHFGLRAMDGTHIGSGELFTSDGISTGRRENRFTPCCFPRIQCESKCMHRNKFRFQYASNRESKLKIVTILQFFYKKTCANDTDMIYSI